MPNTNHAISQWLSQGDRAIQLVLQHCSFDRQDAQQNLDIHCPRKLLDVLITHLHSLKWAASRSLVKSVDIHSVVNGETAHELSLFPDQMPINPIAQSGADPLGLMLLAKLGMDFANPIAIVEMGTNRGVFCSTGILEQSKADIDLWIDNDMAKYHYPAELKKLEDAVGRGVAHGVEWTAKTFQGDPVAIAANVYAGELNGKPVRVTENLNWQLI